MKLLPEEIALIAEWQPTQAGFGRDEPATAARVRSVADRLKSSGLFDCDLLMDDGLSNYFVLFAYTVADVPSFSFARSVEGLLVYLSACAPVGVAGHSRRCVDPGIRSFEPLLIDDLITHKGQMEALVESTFEAIRFGGYELLSAVDARQPLPLGVTPFEYCSGPCPWDRVFHALFSDTD